MASLGPTSRREAEGSTESYEHDEYYQGICTGKYGASCRLEVHKHTPVLAWICNAISEVRTDENTTAQHNMHFTKLQQT